MLYCGNVGRSLPIVEILILVLIFFREYLWDGCIWLRNRGHASIDRKVIAYLGGLDRGAQRTVEEIVAGIPDAKKPKPEQVAASLQRLFDKYLVEEEQGRWYKIRRYVTN